MMVMPFSRSRDIESMTRSATWALERKMPLCQSIASTSVVLPWSTWAMMAMFRMSSLFAGGIVGPPCLVGIEWRRGIYHRVEAPSTCTIVSSGGRNERSIAESSRTDENPRRRRGPGAAGSRRRAGPALPHRCQQLPRTHRVEGRSGAGPQGDAGFDVAQPGAHPVSYTHLTLPTSDLV